MERQNSITKNGNLNRLSASSATEQNQVPPSYAVNLPDGDRGYAPDSKSSYIQDGTNLKPISDRSSTDGVDLERGNSKVKRILNVLFPCARIYRSTKERYGPVTAVAAFVALLLVLLAAIGGIIFGIIVGVEKGLTG